MSWLQGLSLQAKRKKLWQQILLSSWISHRFQKQKIGRGLSKEHSYNLIINYLASDVGISEILEHIVSPDCYLEFQICTQLQICYKELFNENFHQVWFLLVKKIPRIRLKSDKQKASNGNSSHPFGHVS
jgi:hypothetical protein